MVYAGCHLSTTDGYEAMGKKILTLGGNTFAFFTRNPRGGKTRELDLKDVQALQDLMAREGFGPLVAHGSYTMNLCSANEATRANGLEMLQKDLQRMAALPGCLYNFHPGSHTGQGSEKGIRLIAEGLNTAMGCMGKEQRTTVLLETMAGKGSEVGSTFEELRSILDLCDDQERLGVCLDTCHVWDAGYDIGQDLDGVLEKFDRVIGLERLQAIHLNDSKNPLGAHKDRHEKLGQGCIGEEALKRVITHPALQGLPFILETPNEDEGYAKEIQMILSCFFPEKS